MPAPASTSRRPVLVTGVGVCLACLAFLATACGGASDAGSGTEGGGSSGTVRVVASTDVYGDIVERIGGRNVTVTSLIDDPTQDPHSYEADARNQLALSKAEVVVENGGGYDDFVDRMLKSSGRDSTQVINVVDVSGKHAPAGGELNEHVWYDFPTMARLADRLSTALAKADPGHAADFRKNAGTFKTGLAGLEKKEAQIKAAHSGEGVAVTEPVPLYLIEACGLVNRTPEDFSEAIEEGDDVSPKALRATLALFGGQEARGGGKNGGGAEVLVSNEQTSGPQTDKVEKAARAAGVPVVPVTETLPAGKDYTAWMNANVDALADALSKAGTE